MSGLNPNVAEPTPSQNTIDDEIDLRQYINLLIRKWYTIAIVTIVAASLAASGVLILRAITPPTYEASAVVVIARVTSNVNISENFQTQLQNGSGDPRSYSSRHSAMLSLVKNGDIAKAVIEDMGEWLNENERWPARLVGKISASAALGDNGTRPGDSALIVITAKADRADKAAALANSWAVHYVDHINSIYGQVPQEIIANVESELILAEETFEQAQSKYETFIAENNISSLQRLINEKQSILSGLEAGKLDSIDDMITETLTLQRRVAAVYLNAQHDNRLLAFEKEQEANQAFLSTLIDAESANRLLAIETDQASRTQLFEQYANTLIQNRLAALTVDQEARTLLFTEYITAEIENRLTALRQDQAAKTSLFETLSQADIDGKVAVYQQQVDSRIAALTSSYETQRRLQRLLLDARGLREQVAQAGEAGAVSASFSLLLLKSKAYAAESHQPGLFFHFDSVDGLDIDPQNQAEDLDALINVLETRVNELDQLIGQQSARLFNNEGYQLLDGERPEEDALYQAIRQRYLDLFEIGELPALADDLSGSNEISQAILTKYDELFDISPLSEHSDSIWQDSDLSNQILAKYEELFGVGPLASASLVLSNTTPIYQVIEAQYPQLFSLGSLTMLTEDLYANSELNEVTAQKIEDLFKLEGIEDIPGYAEATEPFAQTIVAMEEGINTLQAQLENQTARHTRLIEERDLAHNAYSTLNSKVVDLRLQRTASNREVSLGTVAIPPFQPEEPYSLVLTTLVAAMLGFVLSIFIIFIANYLGDEPAQQTYQQPAPSSAGAD